MTVDWLIFWLFVVAWAVVLGALGMQIPRAVGEVLQIVRHIRGLIESSPLPLQLAKAESDLRRIEAAAARLPMLQARAQAAMSVIRETPLVPPGISAFIERLRSETAAFRREAR